MAMTCKSSVKHMQIHADVLLVCIVIKQPRMGIWKAV